MYLKVVNGTRSKDFTLTNQYNQKPYMVVNGNQKLPLTTNPPKDYSTSSESGSYYTTAVNSAGLYNTTALTRVSTYETIYGTRVSTYNTVYGTSANGLYCMNVTKGDSTNYFLYSGTRTVLNRTSSYYNQITSTFDFYGNPAHRDYEDGNRGTATKYNFAVRNSAGDNWSTYISYTQTITTGTTYLTQASTSATSYLTRSSTSAYQGISSTSSSASYITNPGGNIFIKVVNGTKTYRPLEYMQSSQSATYKTSFVNSLGLSSTTALTRASTYETIYDTRASTYNTLYGTIGNGLYCMNVIKGDSTNYFLYSGTLTSLKRLNVSGTRSTSTFDFYGNPAHRDYADGNRGTATKYNFMLRNSVGDNWSTYISYTQTITTGTTYLTQASTYNTRYNTRASTYAYSGVSSSSQSTFSWL